MPQAYYPVNASGGDQAFLLPKPGNMAGWTYLIQKVDSTGGQVIIQSLDVLPLYSGTPTWSFYPLVYPGESVQVYCDGEKWMIQRPQSRLIYTQDGDTVTDLIAGGAGTQRSLVASPSLGRFFLPPGLMLRGSTLRIKSGGLYTTGGGLVRVRFLVDGTIVGVSTVSPSPSTSGGWTLEVILELSSTAAGGTAGLSLGGSIAWDLWTTTGAFRSVGNIVVSGYNHTLPHDIDVNVSSAAGTDTFTRQYLTMEVLG